MKKALILSLAVCAAPLVASDIVLPAAGRAAQKTESRFAARGADDWDTDYEKSGGKRTPRYAETIDYCRRLDAASPWVRYTTFGKSPQGRDLPLVIASRSGVFTPEKAERARAEGHVVVLIQAGIHAGEIEGKDAGLMLLRDIAVTKKFPGLLDHVTILFIPIFNVDGHERFGPHNRINQNGPEEMGWRTTAAGLNLNRDYLKADAAETRAWLALFNAWMPDFFMDCHTTDGADYQYVITYIVDVFGNMAAPLSDWARDVYLAAMEKTMEEAGYPMSPYVFLVQWPDPKSGMIAWASSPRFSQGYTSIQNRPGVLIETHMLKDYATRVDGTYQMLKQTIELVGRERAGLREAISEADALASNAEFRKEPFPLRFWVDKSESVMIDFKGVSYESVKSDLTGGTWHRFSDRPETFPIPYFTKQRVLATADLPEAYIVPPEWTAVIERLRLHGVAFTTLESPAAIEVHSWRFTNPRWQQAPYEGRHPVSFDAEPIVEKRVFPAGSILIDMNQRRSQVAAHILEPEGPDSYVQWGFFDAVFEQKEYADSYVMERVAREMLRDDEALRREFEEKKTSDPEFAKEPRRILDWFYRKTPWWDDRKDVYPVGKIFDRAVAGALAAGGSARAKAATASARTPAAVGGGPTRRLPDHADRVRIAEARRIVERFGENLWPGFAKAPSAVLLVTPETEYLFNHPAPTNDFAPVGFDSLTRTDVYARDRVFAANLLATFPAVGGVPTAVMGQPRRTQASHSTRWVATLLHEHFHQLQDSQADYSDAVGALGLAGGDTTGMWMLDYPFAYDSRKANETFSRMCRRLYEALEAIGRESFRERVASYLEARRDFCDSLDADDYAYFSFQVWKEGIARYTEVMLVRSAAAAYTPTKAFEALPDRVAFARDADETYAHVRSELLRASLKKARRTAFYHVGAAEGFLLDQVNPGWRARYFTEKFFVERYFEAGAFSR